MTINGLLDRFLVLVIELTVTAVFPLAFALIFRWFKRLGVQVSAEQQKRLEALAEHAALASEEWAAAQIKQQLPVGAAAKLERALEILQAHEPKLVVDDAHDLIHAALLKANLGASKGSK